MRHLYVHIPFCRSRCAYCDFASEEVAPHAQAGRVERYLAALRAELDRRLIALPDDETPERSDLGPAAGGPGSAPFETIYVGGGTPTVLPERDLLDLVRRLAGLLGARDSELTVEANPGTISCRLLEGLRQAGATRLSLGIQSFSPAIRDTLGRRVSQEEIEDALLLIMQTGWQDWNLDLIFGIPAQTWSEATADLEAAVAARPSHISLYDLTYTSDYKADIAAMFGQEAQARASSWAEQHYSAAVAGLEKAGYRRYEVSNFALPGYECRHNESYWKGEDYLGIGVAAVSTIGNERRTNPSSLADYLAGVEPKLEHLSPLTRIWERAMLGLRTREGVQETEVLAVLDTRSRDRLLARGCLERHCGKLRLNPGFLDVSNAIISDLLVSPEELQLAQTPVGDGTNKETKNNP